MKSLAKFFFILIAFSFTQCSDAQNTILNKIIIEKVSPWGKITGSYKPHQTIDPQYNILTTVNGSQYGAFIITNSYPSERIFNCGFTTPTSNIVYSKLYTVPFITEGKKTTTADALVDCSKPIKLQPNESRMFVFAISGKKAGNIQKLISIKSLSYSYQLHINAKVIAVTTPNTGLLNAVNWAYFTNVMTFDRIDQAVADLRNHHTNSIVIPPGEMPIVGASDFTEFQVYISKLKQFDKVILFMNFTTDSYKNSFKTTPLLSPDWKKNFIDWYTRILAISNANGIASSKLYLYPYDEISDPDIENFKNFLSWLKTTFPNAKTFATLTTTTAENELIPKLSIAQILYNKDLLNNIKQISHKNIWIYDTKDNTQLLSAYSYYRLMAWNAFFNDFEGIGFWNYAYSATPESKMGWNHYQGENATYSVIYDGPEKSINSSRRWEAFKLGIEDFELLKRYAQKEGLLKAKALAAIVVNNPDDINKADEIRDRILTLIAK